ncbi:MAG: SRPBCC family protein [Thermoleophilaceae bacterium]
MSRRVDTSTRVPISPEAAVELWRDVRRWPSFVEGFARVLDSSGAWPEPGAKVVWESGPVGRGRVTEKVVGASARSFSTRVAEERLLGTQTFRAEPAEDGATVAIELEYELTSESPLRGVTDVLFIRRALRDALGRTLGRFRVEAEEDAGLR